MLGGIEPSFKEATIIGGGIAGMIAAYRLGDAGYEVSLHEKAPWLGGMLGSTQFPYGLVEKAAHSIRASKAVQKFCADIGVELVEEHGSGKSYIWRGGEFRRMPLAFGELLTLITRALTQPAPGKPETLESFGQRHMGQAAVDYLLTPMCFGIYGARPAELEVPLAFPRFRLHKGQPLFSRTIYRRFKGKGRSPMMAPKNGMADIVAKLAEQIDKMPNVQVHVGGEVEFLTSTINRIVTVPAYEAAKLLEEEDTLTSGLLRDVTYVPLISATVFVEREAMRRFPGGVGVLVPERENIPVLGVLFNSASFENRISDSGLESLTLIMGGTPHPEMLNLDDAAIEAHVMESMEKLFGLARAPLKIHINRWPRAIPLYNSHLALTQQRAREGWCALLGNMLFGNYTGQVSLRGLIESSQALVYSE